MPAPYFVDLPADQWVKVASSVRTGQVSVITQKPQQLLHTFRDAGDENIPTEEEDGVALSRKSIQIRSNYLIDVYIRPQREISRVRVDI